MNIKALEKAWMNVANKMMRQMQDKSAIYTPIPVQAENAINNLVTEYDQLKHDDIEPLPKSVSTKNEDKK